MKVRKRKRKVLCKSAKFLFLMRKNKKSKKERDSPLTVVGSIGLEFHF